MKKIKSTNPFSCLLPEKGSVLIGVIIAVTVAAGLGTAMHSMTSTSIFTQFGSMDATRAYLLAESGGQYAIKRIAEIDSSDVTARNDLVTELTTAPFTLTAAGQFSLGASYSQTPGFHKYVLTSVGAPNSASSQTITYSIRLADMAGFEPPFDEAPDNDEALNPDNWNVVGDVKLDADDEELELNDGNADTQISFNWTDPDTSLPDLAEIWEAYNNLLTYEVQIKIKLGDDDDVLAGISFRLNTSGDTDITNDAFYGLSYLWCKDGNDLPGFCGTDSDTTYIVLWKQASDGTQTVISRKEASSVDSDLVDNDGELEKWSTLIVRVQEQINPDTDVRENLIYAYVAERDTYAQGTMHWDYNDFTVVSWDTCATDCSSGGDCSCVADTTYTTEDFSTYTPDEIGIHTFGNEEAEVWDMVIRFDFNNNEATSY
nr:hypothetical protein [Desulfobulbaceae bacterium]